MSKKNFGDDEIFSKPFGSATHLHLLVESLNREKALLKLLKEQQFRNDKLQLQLNMELERKASDLQGKQ